MTTVTIRHPEAGEAQVPASAVPHWRALGWEPLEDPAEPAGPKQAEQGQTEQQDSKPSGRPRRRSNEESE